MHEGLFAFSLLHEEKAVAPTFSTASSCEDHGQEGRVERERERERGREVERERERAVPLANRVISTLSL